MFLPLRSLLVGADARTTGRYLGVAAALLPLALLASELALARTLGVGFSPSHLDAVVVFGSALAAYRTQSVLAALAFGVFPTLGLQLSLTSAVASPASGLVAAVASPAFVGGVAFACFGWALGATARHLLASLSPTTEPAP